MKKNLSLVFNRSELGAGTRGSSLGIDSILIEASKRMKSFFIESPSVKISDKNQFLFKESKYKWAKYAEPLIDVYKDISETIENQTSNNTFKPYLDKFTSPHPCKSLNITKRVLPS